ncbi:MAG TPA: chorismate-binding protein [Chryseosolibacter sp.]
MNATTSVSIPTRTETEILNFLLSHALENELPLAVWRLPFSSVTYVVISDKYQTLAKNSAIEELPAGFMFAPFDRDKDSIFLPANFMFAFEGHELREAKTPLETTSSLWLASSYSPGRKPKLKLSHAMSGSTPTDYEDLVRKAVAAIDAQQFEKVVPSRTKRIELAEEFDIVDSFQKLSKAYSTALISFVSVPGVGHWLGATPETLVTVEGKTIFKTVALAGTLPYKEGMNLKTVAWTEKEIEEQALVERYVISCFKKIRLREYEEHGPKSMVAGNLIHLKSEFVVDMVATNFPQLGTVMLQLLHPTSAVCGMPLEPALQFLKEHEGYDREFYAGYLGPVNINNNINLFVNLRCMKLMDGHALLYAGAGVTVDSSPEQELAETEMKFKTLLNIL